MNESDLKALIAHYCNGTLSDADFGVLQDELRSNPEARTYFRKYLNLDAALFDAGAAEDVEANAWTAPAKARRIATKSSPLVWLPAAAAAIMVLVGFLLWKNATPALNQVVEEKEEVREDVVNGFAVLTHLNDAVWPEGSRPRQAGDLLSAGHFQLQSGAAQIEFFSGATVLVEGEADFEIVSSHRARCHRGRLRAEVPPAARGFTIETPETEVIDLGTEIGISVGADGGSEVHVFDGEVELHGEGGGPARSLKSGEALSLANGGAVNGMPADNLAFGRFEQFRQKRQDEDHSRHTIWSRYSGKLQEDPRMIAYYPFSDRKFGERRIVNQANGGEATEQDGTLVGAKRTYGRWGFKGGIEFRRPGDRLRLFIPGQYSSLTLACWVRLDSVERMWNSLYLTDGYEPGEVHWQINEGKLTYSMRINEDRQPHNYLYQSPVFWKPELRGQWIHLATTFDSHKDEVVHYLDGRELSREQSPANCKVEITRFGAGEIGNWGRPMYRTDPEFAIRSLNGLMDEFSIFSVALKPDEIQEMYEIGKPVAP